MNPELARTIAHLRTWLAEGETAKPDTFAYRLGQGEAMVSRLLDQLDQEGAGDDRAE